MNQSKVDEDDDDVEMVDIRVMIKNPSKGTSDKTNTIDVKTFPGIKNLMGAGLQVLKLC